MTVILNDYGSFTNFIKGGIEWMISKGKSKNGGNQELLFRLMLGSMCLLNPCGFLILGQIFGSFLTDQCFFSFSLPLS